MKTRRCPGGRRQNAWSADDRLTSTTHFLSILPAHLWDGAEQPVFRGMQTRTRDASLFDVAG